MVSIDKSHAIFVVRQLQEQFQVANKGLYMAFVDLEKAFDRVPRKVIWWTMRKLGVEECVIRLYKGCTQTLEEGFVLVKASVGSLECALVFTKVQC